jgi:tetratricopeptide (TPR) repeat protein
MKAETIDWEKDIRLNADESYQSLRRSLIRTDGFSLFFVRCLPVTANQIISDIHSDLSTKTIEVLDLKESIDNLYDRISALPRLDRLNILFIKGLEHSIFAYEDREMNDINLRSRSSVYGGTWKGVPRVLGHLNLSRERFRDNFNFCLVFLLPEFALRYFIRRAPDFFDWRSNVYEFHTDKEIITREASLLVSGDYDEYLHLTLAQRTVKLSAISSYLDEKDKLDNEADLWFEKGIIHSVNSECEQAIVSYDWAIEIKPDKYEAWYHRGNALDELGRYEEAIASFDHVLEIKPDVHEAWNNRGYALAELDRYEEALTSFDHVLEIKPDVHEAWNNRGVTLKKLGRYEEAIASYERVLEVKPDFHEAWFNRGNALDESGRYEEAIASYDHVLEIEPDNYEAWLNRLICLEKLGKYEVSIKTHVLTRQMNSI